MRLLVLLLLLVVVIIIPTSVRSQRYTEWRKFSQCEPSLELKVSEPWVDPSNAVEQDLMVATTTLSTSTQVGTLFCYQAQQQMGKYLIPPKGVFSGVQFKVTADPCEGRSSACRLQRMQLQVSTTSFSISDVFHEWSTTSIDFIFPPTAPQWDWGVGASLSTAWFNQGNNDSGVHVAFQTLSNTSTTISVNSIQTRAAYFPACEFPPDSFNSTLYNTTCDGPTPGNDEPGSLAPNSTCSKFCASGYYQESGTNEYTCSATGELNAPSLVCEAISSWTTSTSTSTSTVASSSTSTSTVASSSSPSSSTSSSIAVASSSSTGSGTVLTTGGSGNTANDQGSSSADSPLQELGLIIGIVAGSVVCFICVVVAVVLVRSSRQQPQDSSNDSDNASVQVYANLPKKGRDASSESDDEEMIEEMIYAGLPATSETPVIYADLTQFADQ